MDGQVLRCQRCDTRNRISPQSGKEGVWKCANCGTALRATRRQRRRNSSLSIVKAAAFLIAVLVLPVALWIIPTTRGEIHWVWASYMNALTSYELYLKSWPDGRHADAARARFDEQLWADTMSANTAQALERYLLLFSTGKHVAEAKDRIELLHWEQAIKQNTIRSYRMYISAHPKSKFAAQAEAKALALHSDQTLYEAARHTATEASFEAFLINYPGHASEAAAREALREIREGRDVVDLLREKKVEIVAQGNGIDKISIRLRRLVPHPITVRIPLGSPFVSSTPWAQNMVTASEYKLRLITSEWQPVTADAACVNRSKSVPGSNETFTVERSPAQPELAKLMPVLARTRVDSYTRQAAVWIVTDNASFEDLGILVVGFGGFGFWRAPCNNRVYDRTRYEDLR